MSAPASTLRRWAPDLLIALLVTIAVVWLLRALAHHLPDTVYGSTGGDAWFGADTPRTLANMVDAHSNHYRTKVHPISSLLLHPAVLALRSVWPGTDLEAAMRIVKLVGVLWASGFYALGRLTGLGRAASLCFTALAVGSAAFQFWFSLAETFFAGSLTLLAVLLVAAVAVHRPLGDRWLIAANVASLSITVTNWAAGLALAIAQRPWRRAVRIGAIALLIVSVLALIQRGIYHSALLFFFGSREELHYINQAAGGSWADRLIGMLWYPIHVPPAHVHAQVPGQLNNISVQMGGLGITGAAGWAALALWGLLLAAGVQGLLRTPRWHAFGKVVGLTLGAHIALHLVYGEETFLYAAHFLPLLMAVVLFAHRSSLGRAAPLLALLTAGLVGFHNFDLHAAAAELLHATPAP
ncbi:hypothetical protein [Variovorax sp. ZT4R33]|uniref:hypothetical protein n=1 Tax=Variovorax sp. ZT4R33 TaxID=3443743 RepID=UPI003F47EEEC